MNQRDMMFKFPSYQLIKLGQIYAEIFSCDGFKSYFKIRVTEKYAAYLGFEVRVTLP